MKKLITLLLLAIPAFCTTTVSGNMKNLGTGAVGQGNFVRFILRGCGNNTPRVTGTGVLQPQAGNQFYFDVQSDANGNLSGTLYSTRNAAGTGNGDIECGGSYTAVWYGMVVHNGAYVGPEIPIHAKSGVTLDPSAVTPITIPPVVTAPTGDNTYLRLDGGNSPVTGPITFQGNNTFTGSNTFSGAVNLNGGGNFTGTFTGNPTLSGNVTVGGTFTNTGLATFNGGITDSQSPGTFGNAQYYSYIQSLINSCNPTTEFQATQGAQFAADAVTGCIVANSSSTSHQVNGGSFYSQTSSTSVNAVGVYGQARSIANAGNIWGANFLAQDAPATTSTRMEGIEVDLNVNTPPSLVYGIQIAGQAGVNLPSNSAAVTFGPLTAGHPWPLGVNIGDASSTVAIAVGALATSANSNSMPINFNARNGSNVTVTSSVLFDPFGDLIVQTGASSPGIIVSTYRLGGGTMFLSATAPTISSGFGTSPSIVANNGTAAFQVNVGTGGTATNGVIGLPSATTGWWCKFDDITTQSATVFATRQIASATNSVTIANFNTSGAQAAWVASDKLNGGCLAY